GCPDPERSPPGASVAGWVRAEARPAWNRRPAGRSCVPSCRRRTRPRPRPVPPRWCGRLPGVWTGRRRHAFLPVPPGPGGFYSDGSFLPLHGWSTLRCLLHPGSVPVLHEYSNDEDHDTGGDGGVGNVEHRETANRDVVDNMAEEERGFPE